MTQFKIYSNHLEELVAVKQGWSWPAFFFTWIWAFVNKMWKTGGFSLAAMAIIGGALIAQGNMILWYFIVLAIGWAFGKVGNAWKEDALEQRGYKYIEAREATTAEAAVADHVRENRK